MGKSRIIALSLLLLWLMARSATFLVIDQPEKSDAIVVLAGETGRRPSHALALLSQGYASRLIVDVPADATAYGTTYVDLARKWADSLPQASSIEICPIYGLSTKAEARESGECVHRTGGKSVLVVTSDFHTRRSLSIFRHEIKDRRLFRRGRARWNPVRRGMVAAPAMG